MGVSGIELKIGLPNHADISQIFVKSQSTNVFSTTKSSADMAVPKSLNVVLSPLQPLR